MRQRLHIKVTGTVQGVGFRPFVYRLAVELGLGGWVLNATTGVEIEVEGEDNALSAFVERLQREAPPLARIEAVSIERLASKGESEFTIRESKDAAPPRPIIPPDVATCLECFRDISEPANRRYFYPFTNCTNCGPRFTIIEHLPYDRPNTTMRKFSMCCDCAREYHDPSNRRFHAQPNACPHCGPQIWLTDAHGNVLYRGTEAVLRRAGELIRNGCIIAIKGLGGFHLACDARNSSAVRLLRARKRRPAKPFAIMCVDENEVKRIVHVTDWELQVLKSPQSPIVLLRERQDSGIAPEVAPNNLYQGVMLPYTPLHALLFQFSPPALVMTSGNLSEEPLCYRNDEALERLSGIADYFLLHDRDIHVPCDDSVVRPMAEGITVLRRARGYVPMPVDLPFDVDMPILGTGADLKNAFCIADERWAVMSQHIGDMENIETCDYFRRALSHLCNLLDVEPCVIAHDMHPRYYSTQLARELSGVHIPVQHHYAHVLSCMVENGITESVIGIAFDGTGYGTDGTVWGGEVLLCTLTEFKRVAHLLPMPLAGGEAAIRKPARLAFSYIWSMLDADALHHHGMERALGYLDATELRIIPMQVARRLNTPMTSSMGRLFDAVSALLGICGVASYEGQAAMELEMMATHAWDDVRKPLRFAVVNGKRGWVLDPRPMLMQLLELIQCDEDVRVLAARFHRTIVEMVAYVCECIRTITGVSTVALSGGVFQNRLLTEGLLDRLSNSGLRVLLHRKIPPNDGGIALGQITAGSHLHGMVEPRSIVAPPAADVLRA